MPGITWTPAKFESLDFGTLEAVEQLWTTEKYEAGAPTYRSLRSHLPFPSTMDTPHPCPGPSPGPESLADSGRGPIMEAEGRFARVDALVRRPGY